jgi:hypothetical protein
MGAQCVMTVKQAPTEAKDPTEKRIVLGLQLYPELVYGRLPCSPIEPSTRLRKDSSHQRLNYMLLLLLIKLITHRLVSFGLLSSFLRFDVDVLLLVEQAFVLMSMFFFL